jgi:hypothetical protein
MLWMICRFSKMFAEATVVGLSRLMRGPVGFSSYEPFKRFKRLKRFTPFPFCMQQLINLRLLPSEAADEASVKKKIAASAGKKINAVSGYQIIKKSIDARGKTIYINLHVKAFYR